MNDFPPQPMLPSAASRAGAVTAEDAALPQFTAVCAPRITGPPSDSSGGDIFDSAPGMVSEENSERRPDSTIGQACNGLSAAHETPGAPSAGRPIVGGSCAEAHDAVRSSAPPTGGAAAPPYQCTDAEHKEAQEKEILCLEFQRLTVTEGMSLTTAARALGKSPSWFSGAESPYARWRRDGIAGLLPRRGECGAKPSVFATLETDLPWFIPACQFFYRHLNRTSESGSAPEAIRRAVSMPHALDHRPDLVEKFKAFVGVDLVGRRCCAAADGNGSQQRGSVALPECPASLREAILAREREGKDMLPERLLRQIVASAPVIRAIRSPRDAWLRYVESPGSLMLTVDEDGIERYLEPGEWWTLDDGTINFICHVGLTRPGDKCWDRFGVCVGRFQFLLAVDHRSYFITGFSYTARPRSSYRAEDLNATMHTAFSAHGRPRAMVLERGISAARLVSEALDAAGVRILRATSPHQKVVEGVFNKLWTRLSMERGQVGRFRGEEEETNRLLTSCREGHTDPRRHFHSLEDVLRALREAIAEHNAGVVNGRYGRWIPQEFFTAHAAKHLRPLAPDSAWIFSPVVAAGTNGRGLLVRTSCIKTQVQLFPGFSNSFAFSCPSLGQWYGARVKLWFNPLAEECTAKVTLAEDWRGTRAGTVIGDAPLFDRQARHTLRTLGYGAYPDIGLAETRSNALALRRVAQAVTPGRKDQPAPVVEVRSADAVTAIAAALPTAHSQEPMADNAIDLAARRAEIEEFERTHKHLIS